MTQQEAQQVLNNLPSLLVSKQKQPKIDYKIVRTVDEIESIVRTVPGTWVKRKNVRNKLISSSNSILTKEIQLLQKEVRMLISKPASEKREIYSQITQLELKLI